MPIVFVILAIFIRNRRRGARAATVASVAPATSLSMEAQWSKVVGIVSASIDRATATQRYHAAAEDQLDAAAYALSNLMDELAAVMVMPASRPGTSVVRLQPTPVGVTVRHWAAAAA